MSDLPSGWEWVTTGDLFTFVTSGSRGWARYYSDEGAPFIRIGNLQRGSISPDLTDLRRVNPPEGSEGSRTRIQPNDILISITADLGRVALIGEVKEDSYINQHIALARPIKGINASYLAWYLSTCAVQRRWMQRQRGATKLGLGLKDIRSLSVPVPPRAEQDAIVATIEEQFSRIAAGVGASIHAQQRLGMMRASILNGILRRETGDFYRDVPLGDVLERGRYGTSAKCSPEAKGYPVLRIPNVQSGRVNLSDLKYAIDTSVDLSGHLVDPGDVLIIRTNGSRSLIGRSAVVPTLESEVAFASYLIQLKLNSSVIDPAYLSAALSAPHMRRKIEALAATTAGQYNISLGKLRSLLLPLPPLVRQRSALSEANRLLAASGYVDLDIKRVQTKASNLRSSILSAAFSGKLA